jgi:phospholipase/carboxylesterase
MSGPVDLSVLESVFLPAKLPGPERLLVVLHGLGDSLEGFRFLPKMLQIPGLNYLLVNAPDRYFTGFSWFDLYGEMDKGVERSRGLLFEAVGEIQRAGWRSENIGWFGFSQGCLMALDLACRHPERFGAFVGVSGFVSRVTDYPEGFSPVARSQRILMTHGTVDPMLPLEGTRKQANALIGMGMRIEFKVYSKEHTIDPHQEVADIRSFLLKTLSSGQ